jgi:hypothetical protein
MYARHRHKENTVIDSLSALKKIVDHLVNLLNIQQYNTYIGCMQAENADGLDEGL